MAATRRANALARRLGVAVGLTLAGLAFLAALALLGLAAAFVGGPALIDILLTLRGR